MTAFAGIREDTLRVLYGPAGMVLVREVDIWPKAPQRRL